MQIYKKWLNVAIIFILSLSLLSPAAVMAEEQGSELNGQLEEQITVEVNNLSTETTTNDSAQIEVKTNKQALQAAIEEAENNKASVKVSVDGTDIDPAENWVTQADLDAYTTAIKSAQGLIADTAAIQDAINAKTLALNQSTDAFNQAKKAGVKNSALPAGYVTIAVEKFTLGQGYAIEPIQVPFYEGNMVGEIVATLLGSGNYNNGRDEENISYLANIRDSISDVNIPQYIQTEITKQGASIRGKANSEWLGQFDYTDMSGWMYTVNHEMPNVGMSSYDAIDGDVIRLHFTVFGYGSDLGFGWGSSYIEVANKDALTTKVAEINSDSNKAEILARANVQQAYDAAYRQLTNIESSQANIDTALAQLTAALNGEEVVIEADKTALQAAVTAAKSNIASAKVSVDGKDVDPTGFWVTQDEIAAYEKEILSVQQLIENKEATQIEVDEKLTTLTQATQAYNQAKKAGLKTVITSEVKFTVAPKTVILKLFDDKDQEVNIGDGLVGSYNVYTATLPAGDYRYEGFDGNKSVGGGKLAVTTDANQEFQFRQLNFKASNKDWKVGQDYTIKVGQESPDDTSLKFGDETTNGQVPILALTGKTYFYTFEPDAKHSEHIALSDSRTITLSSSAQLISAAIPFSGNVTFTVPQEAQLFVGKKNKHFVAFEEIKAEGEAITNDDGTKTYKYKLSNNGQYNYRVSQAGKLTNTGVFTANGQNAALEITKEQLEIQSPQAILNKDTYLEGNIYLNINEQNHLKLNQGEQFKLLPLRSWQALIEGINNYFFEPDFHYEIISGMDVVEIEPGKPGSYATVKALKNGTAIVKVTYDALKVNGSTYIKDANDAYSAIWPENVGLFVVSVGQGETGISTGIESNKERNQKANEGKIGNLQNGVFDADIDSVYYVEGEPGAYYTFTPTEGSSVSVLRPDVNHGAGTVSYGSATFSTEDVTSNKDGAFTVLLSEGRNIVKVEKDGKAEYHVMTARPLDVTIENLTKPNEQVTAGDKVKVTFKGLSFPANKLSGIYNFNARLNIIGGPENQLIQGLQRQYNIATQANDVTFTIPEDHKGDYILRDGHIGLNFFGSPIGDHRNIDPTVGANPNFTASMREGYYSILPTITIIEDTTVTADKTALQAAVTKAETNKASVKVSVDGTDIDPTEYWVTQADLDAYTTAIKSAQDLIADTAAIQDAINAKTLALNQSTEAFNQAKKAGTKSTITTPTEQAYNTVGQYMLEKAPNPKFGSEWFIISLARGGATVPSDYYDTYYKNVVEHVKSVKGELHKRKYTEYSRLIIALTAIGKDPRDVGGYNLVEKLSNFDDVVWQGVNGAYFALIALDTWDFELPETATTTKEKLVDYILNKQLADGGWDLSDTKADPDMTAMAIQSLAPYYNSHPKVKVAVDHALTTLATMQKENGGYATWGTENVESAAQVVTALASLGIDANADPRFNKVIANIMTYYSPVDGGFKHVLTQKKADGMATEQVGYTLAAHHRVLKGQPALYEMSDTKSNPPTNPGEGENPSNPGEGEDGNTPTEPGDGDGENGNNPGNGDGNSNPGGNIPYGTATFSIKISSSEIPLTTTNIEFYEGETVFDVLKRATELHGIALSYRDSQYGIYVEGIDDLYEFDRGPLSGWMYRVNGIFPSFSAALYTLQPGDRVEWLYTLDLGKDVGGYVDGVENGEAPGEEIKPECKEGATDCKEETDKKEDKEKDKNQENNNNPEPEITVEEGDNKAVITAGDLAKYLANDVPKLVVKIGNQNIEIPKSSLKGITLAQDEQVVATIATSPNNDEFTVDFGIQAAEGTLTPIPLGKDYLKVTLPADDVTPNTVVLQLVEGEYKPVPHTIINGKIVLFTKTGGTFITTEKQVTFKDIEKLANKDEIEFLASRFIIQGVTEESFEPNKAITRAQFAALISRSLGLQATGTNPFADTEGKWYAEDVQALFEAGITKGTTPSTFNPEAPITRQQAAAFTARILEYLNVANKETGEVNFNDAQNISAEYLPYIELLNSLDIMTGKEDGSFAPGANLTRAQTAKIIKRALNFAGMM